MSCNCGYLTWEEHLQEVKEAEDWWNRVNSEPQDIYPDVDPEGEPTFLIAPHGSRTDRPLFTGLWDDCMSWIEENGREA